MGTHDSSYKYLFSHPQMVRDLIIGFIPDAWLHGCDYSTLEKLPNEYISDDFRHRSDDIIWRVRVSGEWVYLYFLIGSWLSDKHKTAHSLDRIQTPGKKKHGVQTTTL